MLFGICGGIACYKVCAVVSACVQEGAEVQVAMTESATRFVTPLTFQALTGRQVFTSLWSAEGYFGQQHIQLTEQADLLVLAPATAHILGQAAAGLAGDLVSTMVLSAACPVVFCPSMNTRMWTHPAVQANVQVLREYGHRFIEPGEGWLACRTVGAGRLPEPDVIVAELARML